MSKQLTLAVIDEVIASYKAEDPCHMTCHMTCWSCTRLAVTMRNRAYEAGEPWPGMLAENLINEYAMLARRLAKTAYGDSLFRAASEGFYHYMPYWWSKPDEHKEERLAMLTEFRAYVEKEYV